jgi:hypothetical protein
VSRVRSWSSLPTFYMRRLGLRIVLQVGYKLIGRWKPVVGMTSGVCQGQHYLPAGVPGISTALSQEDRLCPYGRLCQQPADDSTEESQSRRRRQDDKIPPTAASPKVARPRQDRQRRRTGITPATPGLHQPASRSLPHERIRGKREGICLPDACPRGERCFIK